MNKYLLILTLTIILIGWNNKANSQEKYTSSHHTLTHHLSGEELNRLDEIGKNFTATDPPPGPVRNIAEYEHMEGVLICYPFGIPFSVIAEMSEDVIVTTIVANTNQQSQVLNLYTNNGVNVSNCDFFNCTQ